MTVQQHVQQLSTKERESVERAALLGEPFDAGLGTPAEVADFMRTTPAKLANDRYVGVGLPYVKFNKKVLYRWEDVHNYVAANLRQAATGRD